MPTITLPLTDEAANDYATFYGYKPGGEQAAEDFVTAKLLSIIQNDLIEKRNRDAIAIAQAQPLPSITTEESL